MVFKDLQERVREMEQTNLVNLGKEETLEAKIHDLTDQFAIADSRAEFAERSVDKLETTIDNLLSDLYQQVKNNVGKSFENFKYAFRKSLTKQYHKN